MAAVLLPNLHMEIASRSYVDAMHAILTHAGWTTISKPMLSGMTVTGFRLSVHHRLTAESTTAYNWMAENFLAVDFLGITSSQAAGFSFDATFPLYQKHAVSFIKKSMDRGVGVIFWKDIFVIAVGYDEDRQVFYYSDGVNDEHQTLPYANFGINESPYWYYQIFEDRIEMDEIAIYKESLMQAVYKWEEHDLMLPDTQYACGRNAYDAIMHALRTGDYDRDGARETFRCFAAWKRDIRQYMEALQLIWPQMSEAAAQYGRLERLFARIVETTDAADPTAAMRANYTADTIELLAEAQRMEESAIQCIKAFMRETIDNRHHDIALR